MTDDPLDDDPLSDDGLDFLLDDALADDELETSHNPTPRALRRQLKRHAQRLEGKKRLLDLVAEPPRPGEQIHLVGVNRFDFWTWAPALLEWLKTTDHLYASTWILNRNTARELFELIDAGRIPGPRAHILTGTYFKRRESAVYSYLVDGLTRRGGRFLAFANHSKVLLLANARRRQWFTVETSANLTENNRAEQFVLTNDRGLHDFYRDYFDELLSANAAAAE